MRERASYGTVGWRLPLPLQCMPQSHNANVEELSCVCVAVYPVYNPDHHREVVPAPVQL